MKNCEQVFYNMGFKDVENSTKAIVFQAWKLEFAERWMAAVNTISLPETYHLGMWTKFPCPRTHP